MLVRVDRFGGDEEIDRHDSVPWCSSWKKACWLLVPGSPNTIGPVARGDGAPSRNTLLPLDSMSSCWR